MTVPLLVTLLLNNHTFPFRSQLIDGIICPTHLIEPIEID